MPELPKYIQIDGLSYLIRGNFTGSQLRDRYEAFKIKYPTSDLSFAQWAVQRGAVYFADRKK